MPSVPESVSQSLSWGSIFLAHINAVSPQGIALFGKEPELPGLSEYRSTIFDLLREGGFDLGSPESPSPVSEVDIDEVRSFLESKGEVSFYLPDFHRTCLVFTYRKKVFTATSFPRFDPDLGRNKEIVQFDRVYPPLKNDPTFRKTPLETGYSHHEYMELLRSLDLRSRKIEEDHDPLNNPVPEDGKLTRWMILSKYSSHFGKAYNVSSSRREDLLREIASRISLPDPEFGEKGWGMAHLPRPSLEYRSEDRIPVVKAVSFLKKELYILEGEALPSKFSRSTTRFYFIYKGAVGMVYGEHWKDNNFLLVQFSQPPGPGGGYHYFPDDVLDELNRPLSYHEALDFTEDCKDNFLSILESIPALSSPVLESSNNSLTPLFVENVLAWAMNGDFENFIYSPSSQTTVSEFLDSIGISSPDGRVLDSGTDMRKLEDKILSRGGCFIFASPDRSNAFAVYRKRVFGILFRRGKIQVFDYFLPTLESTSKEMSGIYKTNEFRDLLEDIGVPPYRVSSDTPFLFYSNFEAIPPLPPVDLTYNNLPEVKTEYKVYPPGSPLPNIESCVLLVDGTVIVLPNDKIHQNFLQDHEDWFTGRGPGNRPLPKGDIEMALFERYGLTRVRAWSSVKADITIFSNRVKYLRNVEDYLIRCKAPYFRGINIHSAKGHGNSIAYTSPNLVYRWDKEGYPLAETTQVSDISAGVTNTYVNRPSKWKGGPIALLTPRKGASPKRYTSKERRKLIRLNSPRKTKVPSFPTLESASSDLTKLHLFAAFSPSIRDGNYSFKAGGRGGNIVDMLSPVFKEVGLKEEVRKLPSNFDSRIFTAESEVGAKEFSSSLGRKGYLVIKGGESGLYHFLLSPGKIVTFGSLPSGGTYLYPAEEEDLGYLGFEETLDIGLFKKVLEYCSGRYGRYVLLPPSSKYIRKFREYSLNPEGGEVSWSTFSLRNLRESSEEPTHYRLGDFLQLTPYYKGKSVYQVQPFTFEKIRKDLLQKILLKGFDAVDTLSPLPKTWSGLTPYPTGEEIQIPVPVGESPLKFASRIEGLSLPFLTHIRPMEYGGRHSLGLFVYKSSLFSYRIREFGGMSYLCLMGGFRVEKDSNALETWNYLLPISKFHSLVLDQMNYLDA